MLDGPGAWADARDAGNGCIHDLKAETAKGKLVGKRDGFCEQKMGPDRPRGGKDPKAEG
jgi:hypothetical protein